MHAPFWHECSQAPQLFESVVVSVQRVPHVVRLQTQAPPLHVVRPEQGLPVTQFPFLSHERGVLLLVQSFADGSHSTHVPPRHAGVEPLHDFEATGAPSVHTSGVVWEHVLSPFVQTPHFPVVMTHETLEQAWFVVQTPFVHTCDVLFEHW